MQGKALAAFAALAIVGGGCGGGEQARRAPEGPRLGVSERRFEQAVARRSVRQVARQRRHLDAAKPKGARAQMPAAGGGDAKHSDSGGGAGQFRSRGDNSIQEFGTEASARDRRRAAESLHAFFDLRARGRWAQACHYMSASVLVTLEKAASISGRFERRAHCPTIVAALTTGLTPTLAREADAVDVGSLRVTGSRAFILYHGAQGVDYAMPMVEEGGQWRVAALAPAPLSD